MYMPRLGNREIGSGDAEEAGSATVEAEETRRQSPPDPDGSRRKTLDLLRTSRCT